MVCSFSPSTLPYPIPNHAVVEVNFSVTDVDESSGAALVHVYLTGDLQVAVTVTIETYDGTGQFTKNICPFQ